MIQYITWISYASWGLVGYHEYSWCLIGPVGAFCVALWLDQALSYVYALSYVHYPDSFG
jgi:hypothetical protein